MQGAPLTPAVDEHRALPGDAPLALHVRDRLRVVDERDRVERRAEKHDLAVALDDARVGRAGPVPVVQRMGKRDRFGVATDGGDPGLGVPQ